MALQWPLALPKASAWETPRPKKYRGYGFRTLLSRAAKVAARRAAKVLNNLSFAEKLERAGAIKKAVPQWWKDAKRRAQELAKKIKDSCMKLDFYQAKELDQVQDMGGFFVPGSEFDQSTKKPLFTIWRQTASGTCNSVACWL